MKLRIARKVGRTVAPHGHRADTWSKARKRLEKSWRRCIRNGLT